MPTPSYGIKHWWRACREDGESLRQFARRHQSKTCRKGQTTADRWLANKKGAGVIEDGMVREAEKGAAE